MAKPKEVRVELIAGTKRFISGLKAGQRALSGFARRAKSAIKGMVVAATAGVALITLGISKSLNEFSDFETGLTEIGTLLQKWGPEVFGKLKTEAQELAILFGQTTKAMTGAKYDIVSAGFTKAAESATVLRASVKAATAGLVDAKTAAGLIITGLRGYQREARDATDVSDTLFTTIRLGRTTFTELAQSLPVVIPTAKAAGVSFKELNAAMAAITLGGIDTRMAAVSLNRLFLSMSAPASEAAKAMKKMGIVVADTTGKMLPLIDIIKQFQGKGLADVKEIAGDVRSARAILALAQNFGKFKDMLGEYKDTTGALGTAFTKMTDTLAFKLRQLRAAWIAVFQNMGDAFSKPYKQAIDNLRKIFHAITKFLRENKAVYEKWAQGIVDSLTAKVKAFWGFLKKPASARWVDIIVNRIQIGLHFVTIALPKILWNFAQIAFRAGKWLFLTIGKFVADLGYKIRLEIIKIRGSLPSTMGGIGDAESADLAAAAHRKHFDATDPKNKGIEQAKKDIIGDIKDLGGILDDELDSARETILKQRVGWTIATLAFKMEQMFATAKKGIKGVAKDGKEVGVDAAKEAQKAADALRKATVARTKTGIKELGKELKESVSDELSKLEEQANGLLGKQKEFTDEAKRLRKEAAEIVTDPAELAKRGELGAQRQIKKKGAFGFGRFEFEGVTKAKAEQKRLITEATEQERRAKIIQGQLDVTREKTTAAKNAANMLAAAFKQVGISAGETKKTISSMTKKLGEMIKTYQKAATALKGATAQKVKPKKKRGDGKVPFMRLSDDPNDPGESGISSRNQDDEIASVVVNVAGSVVSEENLITNIAKGLERRAQQGSFKPKARS